MGRRNRRVIPACVVHSIRKQFPKEAGDAYAGYNSGLDIWFEKQLLPVSMLEMFSCNTLSAIYRSDLISAAPLIILTGLVTVIQDKILKWFTELLKYFL